MAVAFLSMQETLGAVSSQQSVVNNAKKVNKVQKVKNVNKLNKASSEVPEDQESRHQPRVKAKASVSPSLTLSRGRRQWERIIRQKN